MKTVEVAPRRCSGLTHNLPKNVFPANSRDRAARQEPPVKGAGLFIGTPLCVWGYFHYVYIGKSEYIQGVTVKRFLTTTGQTFKN